MIVLDTHVLTWWTQQPEMLSPRADGAIKAADGLAMHDDPADRFICATVLDLEASLLTKDRLLHDLEWLQTVW